MALLYHFHPWVGAARGNCAGNTHDPSCSWFPAGSIEKACNQRAPAPVNRPCKCTHEVPDDFVVPEDIDFEVWRAPNRSRARQVAKHPKGKKKVSARRR